MSRITTPTWPIKPHTKAKHDILRYYLEGWFGILSKWDEVIYVDGFAGPGRYEGNEPGSPLIAMQAALSRRETLGKCTVIFHFIEKDAERFELLKKNVEKIYKPNNFTVKLHQNEFQYVMPSLMKLAKANAPMFVFIDPFGFTGLPMNLIGKILSKRRSEVLINMMSSSINRFLDLDEQKDNLISFFGDDEFLQCKEFRGYQRRVCLRRLYQKRLKNYARYVLPVEMRNKRDKDLYHLFFATDHIKGQQLMRQAFWKITERIGDDFIFSDAHDRQPRLLSSDPILDAKRALMERYQGCERISVEEIFIWSSEHTMFLESHVRAALRKLEEEGHIHPLSRKRNGALRRKNTFPKDVLIDFG